MYRKVMGSSILFAAVVFLLSGCCQAPNPNALYVCFGDSITKGKDSPTYPAALTGLLDLSSNQVANEGDSGESANNGADRIQNLFGSCDAYPNAVALLYLEGAAGLIDWIQETDPILLFDPLGPGYPYQAALNERLGNIKNNIIDAIHTAQSDVDTIYMGNYFYLRSGISPCDAFGAPFLPPAAAEKANHYTDLLNEKIAEAAAETGSILVDINQEGHLEDSADNFIDCNHPSGEGNQIIAEVFYNAITSP